MLGKGRYEVPQVNGNQYEKYQSCDTIQSVCPVLHLVRLYTLTVVTEVLKILNQVKWNRA